MCSFSSVPHPLVSGDKAINHGNGHICRSFSKEDGGVEQGDQGRSVGRPRREPLGRRPAPWRPEHHRHVRALPGVDARRVRRRPERPAGPRREARRRGDGPQRSARVELDFPYEFVTGVSGWCRAAHGGGSPPVVRSLTFETSRGAVHGPFGAADDGAVPFSYPMEGGVVVGFAGRSGWHLDALGLYVAALRPETLCDVVQERGLSAYRSFVYGDGDDGGARPRHHQQRQSKRKPFEWCYK